MRLHDLREQIIQTNDDFWHKVDLGPFYHDRLFVPGDFSFNGASHSHSRRAVLLDDVNISLEWGMRSGDDDDENHPWMEDAAFPDRSTRTQTVDVFLNGALVDRSEVIAVDGYRAYLPRYTVVRTDGGPEWEFEGATYEYRASRWDYYLAQLIDQLSGNSEFDRYVERSGIVLIK